MTCIDVQLANAVRDALITAELTIPSFGAAFTEDQIKRVYLPRFELKDLDLLQILVAPRARTLSPLSRTTQKREHAVQVCVMQRCKPDSELMDELIDLVANIDDTLANLARVVPTQSRPATWLGSTTEELYNIETLEQHGVFRSVITINYML